MIIGPFRGCSEGDTGEVLRLVPGTQRVTNKYREDDKTIVLGTRSPLGYLLCAMHHAG